MRQNLLLLSLAMFIFPLCLAAQTGSVGIGTTTPNTNASLDLGATNKGLLINRVALTAANNPSPMAANVAGMLVYNTATAGTSPDNVSPGVYFNDGSRWIRYVPAPQGLFAKSAGTQSISCCGAITDWAPTTNDFGVAFTGGVFTVPAGMQGWYSISTGYESNVGGGGTVRSWANQVNVVVNGTAVTAGVSRIQVNGGSVNGQIPGIGTASVSINYFLNAGDQVSISVVHNTMTLAGSPQAATSNPVNTYLSILKQ